MWSVAVQIFSINLHDFQEHKYTSQQATLFLKFLVLMLLRALFAFTCLRSNTKSSSSPLIISATTPPVWMERLNSSCKAAPILASATPNTAFFFPERGRLVSRNNLRSAWTTPAKEGVITHLLAHAWMEWSLSYATKPCEMEKVLN